MASVALSFLYVAFVRILQLLRLRREDRDEVAIEVIMLRHEVSVLGRQIVRPALEPADRALLAGLSRLLSKSRLERFFVRCRVRLLDERRDLRLHWESRGRVRPPVRPEGEGSLDGLACLGSSPGRHAGEGTLPSTSAQSDDLIGGADHPVRPPLWPPEAPRRTGQGGAKEWAGRVADLDLVDHEAHGSAYAEMLAHGVVVEVCGVGEFGHTNRSSRIGDRAKEAMAGRIPRRPRVGLRPSCGTSPRRSSSVCQNYM
jgi:hypothetical protein